MTVSDCLWFCRSRKMIIPGPEDLVVAYNESDDTEKTPKADKKNLAVSKSFIPLYGAVYRV